MSERCVCSLKSKVFNFANSPNNRKHNLVNKQLVVIVFIAFIVIGSYEANAQDKSLIKADDTVIINTDLISFTVRVTDVDGHHISGLSKEAFTIFDNNVKQEIEFFSSDDEPASICFIFDYSGSMGGGKLQLAKEALARFMDNGHQADEYTLIGFNKRAQLLSSWTSNHQAILNKLTFAQSRGSTAFFDACYLGLSKLSRSIYKKKVLLVISDGQDNNSRYNFKQVKDSLRESGVSVYCIAIQNTNDNDTLDGYNGLVNLKALSDISGGIAFQPRKQSDLEIIFNYIAVDIRRSYSIGYRPKDFEANGRWRKIKVQVAKLKGFPRLYVRTREGYFAGLSQQPATIN